MYGNKHHHPEQRGLLHQRWHHDPDNEFGERGPRGGRRGHQGPDGSEGPGGHHGPAGHHGPEGHGGPEGRHGPEDHRGRGGRRGYGHHHLHSARKLSGADLQLILLALLERGPAHGYELIRSLEEHSHGLYVPSPGMIYPALTYLEEIEFASVETAGTRKRYRLTDAGRDHLAQNRDAAARILSDMERVGAQIAQARRAEERGPIPEEWDGAPTNDELGLARRELRGTLRELQPSTPEEAARIASVLQTALADIRRGPQPAAAPGAGRFDADALAAAIAGRRSMGLSRLRPDPVDRRLIERMLEAANWAPSHGDTEPWRFTVFSGEGREALAALFEAAHREDQAAHREDQATHREDQGDEAASQANDGPRKRAFTAPVWISIGMSPALQEDGSLQMAQEEEMMAVACAVQNLHLMASALGLAGMWYSKGTSVHPAVARGLGLEPPARLLGFFMCGWPATDWLTGERRPLSEKVRWVEARAE